jgi:heme oxygenase
MNLMLSEKIKLNTKNTHQSLEKKLITRMRPIKDKKDYGEFIGLFYSYFGALELEINKYLELSFLPDYPQRRKSSALAADLSALGMPLPTLAFKNDLPEISNHYQALGALYVIEGSTLGGRIICDMLHRQMGLQDSTGMSFFNGYGELTGDMWQIFRCSMDSDEYREKHEVIISAADHTFIQFANWVDRH